MATVALSALRPFTALAAAGVPVPIIDHEVREAAIQFCDRARVWREIQTLDVVADQADYAPVLPVDGAVSVVEDVYHNRVRLEMKPIDTLKEQYQDWQSQSGTPLYYTQMQPGVIKLVPYPTAALTDALSVRLVFQPARAAETLPDWLYEQYADVLGWGALVRLLLNPGLPCHSPALAAAYQTQFEQGLFRASRQSGKSFTRAPNRVRGYF